MTGGGSAIKVLDSENQLRLKQSIEGVGDLLTAREHKDAIIAGLDSNKLIIFDKKTLKKNPKF